MLFAPCWVCEEHEHQMNGASITTTGSDWPVPCAAPTRSERIAESRRYSWWPEGIPSPRSHDSPGPRRQRSTTGSVVTSGVTSPTAWQMRPRSGRPRVATRDHRCPHQGPVPPRPAAAGLRHYGLDRGAAGKTLGPRVRLPHHGPDAPPTDAGAGVALEAPTLRLRREGSAPDPEKRGLVRRLKRMPKNAVLLFLDATILRLFPPLRFAWAFRGAQAEVRISGRNAKRVLFGVINPRTGHRLVLRRFGMRQEDFQAFLRYLRRHYPGRPLWLLLDRAPCHEAIKSQRLAEALGIKLLWLPKQCSELNAMDQLWKELKRADGGQPPVPHGRSGRRPRRAVVPGLEPSASTAQSRALVRRLLAQGFLVTLLATYLARFLLATVAERFLEALQVFRQERLEFYRLQIAAANQPELQ